MTAPSITIFDDRERLTAAATDHVASALRDALRDRALATLLCAGGSTPGPVYSRLSDIDLDWSQITIGLTDERWVDEAHAASNAAFIKRTLIQNLAKPATLIPMVSDPNRSAFDEAEVIDAVYAQHFPSPDIAVVGMGPDAHTLSWFPGAEGLAAALDSNTKTTIAAIEARPSDVTGPNTTRMTLTLPAIIKAKQILLLVTGEDKRRVLEKMSPDTPIAHLIQAAGSRLTTYWAP
ncbi:MAG: 6-phosphogluconolactonase [Pseudomonadota bacterium]